MAVTKTIEIDGKQVKFKASAAVPRLYRVKFGRDIYKDLRMLEKSVGDNDEDASNMDLFSLELFEDLAWLMARHASPEEVPDNPEDFLDQFNTFSIYQILPQLIDLWVLMLSWTVMISLCHAVVRLPGYLSWNAPFDGAAIRPITKGLSSYIHALPAL